MKTVQKIASDIIAREGGYVDDPDDLGGATKYGVTIGTLRRLGIDNDGDGRVTSSDVRLITRAQATDIYVEHYFNGPRIDELPPVLQASVFDMYVNAGSNAVRILQRLLVDMGQRISVDGVIGPKTIEACFLAQSLAPHHLADAFGIARRNYYYALADRRPKSRKYAKRRDGGKGGWITRAEDFISPRYHLTQAEHATRVASWG
ncbi:holin-associated N-acetylmuramidase [Pacificibacter marinus]|jgi:lysozyme family protein|uniref:Putative Peptidoglycan domain protein n=1 Tax=Pacificibacter marinus TaxID=658057 RepID=A0A1Y5RPV1_9RHOB|nr:holin-associated N-acetylmuramidase [Pacificibacter marinus]SEK17802.1 Predicted Peptidoglycan domain-containing protein [Pacificibacter marinus]SLN19662.1 putative Peptidoglycan domain protein [Pacificibacter marinus]